jgi:Na+/proline symporter
MIYLIAYSIVCIFIVVATEWGRKQTPERFLVAERKIGGIFGAFAVAASWIWAPALFVSTQVGYQYGYSGLVWFVIPNMLALMIFAPLAQLVRRKLPDGFSYVQFIKNKGGHFRQTQLVIQLLVQVVCCAIQLTAGAELLTFVSGASYSTIVIAMALVPLSYCLISGLVSSILTDCMQYIVIVCSIAIIYFNLPLSPQVLLHCQFHPLDSVVLFQFGIGSFLTLIFGIFSNHQQWQRAFAANYGQVRKTFITAGFLHGLVTFSLGTLGVILFQSGYVAHHLQIVGAEYIVHSLPPFCSAVFIVMALSGLCATMSSALCAFGSLYATEIAPQRNPVLASRLAMVALSFTAFSLAIFRIPLIVLWMFCGFIRLSSATPTILSVLQERFSGSAGTRAIFGSIVAGAPLFIYGSFADNSLWRTTGMIVCLIVSIFICLSDRTQRLKKAKVVCQTAQIKEAISVLV